MKPYIEKQPFSQDVRLHFLARNLSGRSSVMTNATFTEIEEGQLLPPAPLSMSREEAQDLADQLYAANIRPSAAAPIAQPVMPAELYAPAANEAVDLLKAIGYVYKQNSAGYLHWSAPIAQPVQPAALPPGFALVPLLMTQAMEDVIVDEWQWEDLLSAAGAITPEQYEQIAVHPAAEHDDDKAVDSFAARMKRKLAQKRSEGKSGWQDRNWTPEQISQALLDHVNKGDPVDVAAYCMFLAERGESIVPLQQNQDALDAAQPVQPAAQKSKLLMEHSGCGHGTQVEQLSVRLNPGDKVMLVMGHYSASIDARTIAQPVQPAPAARAPMTEDQIINLVIKCEKDWNKCAAESNQWKDLYWEEYAVVICRAIEAFHRIESRP